MAKCPKCDSDIPENEPVCPSCGQPINEPVDHTSILGTNNPDGFERYSSTNPPELEPIPKPEPDHTISLGSSEPPDRGNFRLSPSEEIFEKSLIAARRYKIKRLVGRGGMGLVYLAFDCELGLEVALKSLPAEASSDPRYLEMLKQEAKLSMQLTHHNIVRLFDLKEAGASRFMVMEFIPGFSLNDYIMARQKLGEEEAWEILKPVSQALAYAHSQKIIHRDIKPGNILFKTNLSPKELAEYYGREKKFPPGLDIKVADFGIARTVSDTLARVTHMPVSGTLSYMSPEQLRGKRQTKATDVYSLAAVAYELLCGHPPFHQGEIQYQVLNETPEPIPGVRAEYMEAILKGLAKNAGDRPETVLELLETPEKILRGETMATPTQSAQISATSFQQTRTAKSIKWMIPALALLLAAALAFSIYLIARRQKPGEQTVKSYFQPAWKAKDAHKGWVDSLSISADSSLLASGGGNTIKLWKLSNGEFLRSVDGHKQKITALAFSPAKNILASADKDGAIIITGLGNDKTLDIAGKDRVNALCYSPDGKILAAASPDAVKLWKTETGEEIKTYKGAVFFPSNAVGFSPDGKILAAAGANSVIKIWELAKDDPSATVRGNFFRTINALAFSPADARLFATAGSDKQIQFWEAPSGNKIRTLVGHTGAINAVAFSQSGKALASTGEDKTIKLWSATGGNLIESIEDRSCRSLAFTGKYLAAGGDGEISAYKITWAQPAASSPQPSLSSAVEDKTRKVGKFFKNAVNRIKRH